MLQEITLCSTRIQYQFIINTLTHDENGFLQVKGTISCFTLVKGCFLRDLSERYVFLTANQDLDIDSIDERLTVFKFRGDIPIAVTQE